MQGEEEYVVSPWEALVLSGLWKLRKTNDPPPLPKLPNFPPPPPDL